MAKLEQDVHVHLTWDAEPTEEARNLIRNELYKALQEAGWFRELVQAEVHAELKRSGLSAYMNQVPIAEQAELRRNLEMIAEQEAKLRLIREG